MCKSSQIERNRRLQQNEAEAEKSDFGITTVPNTAIFPLIVLFMMNLAGQKEGIDLTKFPDITVSCEVLCPYLLVLCFLFNMPRDIVNKIFLKLRSRPSGSSKGNLHSSLSSRALHSLSSSQALSTLSRVSSNVSKSICDSLPCYGRRKALHAVTRKECFAKLDYIEQLSISDLIIVFRYATDVNQADFDRNRFMAEESQLLRAIFTAMDMAVTVSRGSSAAGAKASGTRKEGDVDALYFVAAGRIFAEWRTLRMVPNGYKRYKISMDMAYRDVMQNLKKIEDGVHLYLRHCETALNSSGCPIASPTLRQVLEHERKTNMHPNLPKLKDSSSASGLLWTVRQLRYQLAAFSNTLGVPVQFPSSKEAALAAYTEVFMPYHGWAVKQVFTHSFGATPPLEKIWGAMDPPQYSLRGENSDQALARRCSDVSEDGESVDNEFLLAMEELGKNIAEKWDDFLGVFNCVSDKEKRRSSRDILVPSSSVLELDTIAETSSEVTQNTHCSHADPVTTVREGTAKFVLEMKPLLQDLFGLIDRLNMNDPSRV